ncbi:MAG: SIS domain-containing protein [Nanoarchaeota archaeon]|nr:SIS domain-containing protein [Nanoarchaeota archaeon]
MKKDAIKDVRGYVPKFIEALENINYEGLQKATDFLRGRDYGKIYTIGNGGSMATAEHMAADLNKWSNAEDQRVRTVSQCLNSNSPEVSALTNDVGWNNLYSEMLRNYGATGLDVLIAYSVHGGKGQEKAGIWSENLTSAISYMNSIKGTTIGITGGDGGAFKDLCDYCVIVPSDSTPIVEGLHSVVAHIIVDSIRIGS